MTRPVHPSALPTTWAVAAWSVTLGLMVLLGGQRHLSVTWRAVMIFPGGNIVIGSSLIFGGAFLVAALFIDRRQAVPTWLIVASMLPSLTCGWIAGSQFSSALQAHDADTYGPMGWGLVALIYAVRVINLHPHMRWRQL